MQSATIVLKLWMPVQNNMVHPIESLLEEQCKKSPIRHSSVEKNQSRWDVAFKNMVDGSIGKHWRGLPCMV